MHNTGQILNAHFIKHEGEPAYSIRKRKSLFVTEDTNELDCNSLSNYACQTEKKRAKRAQSMQGWGWGLHRSEASKKIKSSVLR